jgi:UDP-N-acetylmuramoyl-tripeptide--D-alanyl-D-alanine ligase
MKKAASGLRTFTSFPPRDVLRAVERAVRGRLIEPVRRWTATALRLASKKTFVGVTGSSGKSTTTTLLRHIINGHATAWGPPTLGNALGDIRRALLSVPRSATHVVVEAGAGGPQSLREPARMLRPDLAVITMVRLEHYSHFRTLERVAEEKAWLARFTRPSGTVVVNADDPHAMAAARQTKGRVVTFGLDAHADYRVSHIHAAWPERLTLTVSGQKGEWRIATPHVAEHFWLPVTAAFVAAVELGVPPETAVARLSVAPEVFMRMSLIEVPGGPTFLLDTAKAPYHSLPLAIETLGKARAPYKRFVLGTISDYPGNPRPKYRDAYAAARRASDQVIFCNDHLTRSRASDEDIAEGRFRAFQSVRAAHEFLRETTKPDELVLLKGSAKEHLERIAMAFTEDVRCWQERCGKGISCRQCGLFAFPFEEHSQIPRSVRRSIRKRNQLA